jgi:hypothetical protein
MLINALISWYTSTSLSLRRWALVLLVPAIEYLCLEPARRGINIAIAAGPVPGLATLPLVLAIAVLMAAVISLFIWEFFKLISRVPGRFAARSCLLLMYGWVFLPMYLINRYGSK